MARDRHNGIRHPHLPSGRSRAADVATPGRGRAGERTAACVLAVLQSAAGSLELNDVVAASGLPTGQVSRGLQTLERRGDARLVGRGWVLGVQR